MHTDKFKAALAAELKELYAELTDLGVQNPMTEEDWIPTPAEPSDAEPDPNDLGDRSEDWAERRGTLDVLETRLNNIKRALEKMESGTYGTCELCGETIETDRLEANPSARTCKTHINNESELTD